MLQPDLCFFFFFFWLKTFYEKQLPLGPARSIQHVWQSFDIQDPSLSDDRILLWTGSCHASPQWHWQRRCPLDSRVKNEQHRWGVSSTNVLSPESPCCEGLLISRTLTTMPSVDYHLHPPTEDTDPSLPSKYLVPKEAPYNVWSPIMTIQLRRTMPFCEPGTLIPFVVVQSLSHVQLFATPWTAAHQDSLSTISGVCSNSCPLSQWCYPTISSSVPPLSSCPQTLPGSGSFPVSWFSSSGGQRSEAPASVLPMNVQDWFLLGLTGLISLQSKGLSRVFSSTTIWKKPFFSAHSSLWSNSHIYMTTRKTIALTRWTFVCKVMSLLFSMLSRFVIAFLLRSNRLLILWLQSPSAVILESKKIKSPTVSTFPPPICHEVMGPDAAMVLVFWMLSFKPTLKVIKENRFLPSMGSEGWIRGLLSRQSGCY